MRKFLAIRPDNLLSMSEIEQNIDEIDAELIAQLGNLSRQDMIKYINLIEVKERMKEFFSIHSNTNGDPLTTRGFEHLQELNSEYVTSNSVVIAGGTQLGKTEQIVLFVLAFACSGKGKNVLFVFPNQKFKDDYVKEKIFRPLYRSEEYKPYIKDSIATSTDMLQFGGGLIKFVSANVEADMAASFSADLVVFEELDMYDKKAMAHVPLALGRMDSSDYGYVRAVSNTKSGAIWEWYQRTDKRVGK